MRHWTRCATSAITVPARWALRWPAPPPRPAPSPRLISGPVALETPENVNRIEVISARGHVRCGMAQMGQCDIFVGCAAVADYRPAKAAEQKIKKGAETMQLELVRNPTSSPPSPHEQRAPSRLALPPRRSMCSRPTRATRCTQAAGHDCRQRRGQGRCGFNSDDNAATILWAEGSLEVR